MAKRKPAGSITPLSALVSEQVDRSILVIRGQKVLLDEQLGAFYGVTTKRLVEAFKRNIARFHSDFAFQLTTDEWDNLRSQFATSSLRSQSVTSNSSTHGGRRYAPYAFTEQGAAMFSRAGFMTGS